MTGNGGMTDEQMRELGQWFLSRPETVQALAREFPPACVVEPADKSDIERTGIATGVVVSYVTHSNGGCPHLRIAGSVGHDIIPGRETCVLPKEMVRLVCYAACTPEHLAEAVRMASH